MYLSVLIALDVTQFIWIIIVFWSEMLISTVFLFVFFCCFSPLLKRRWPVDVGGTTFQNSQNSSTPSSLWCENVTIKYQHCTSFIMVWCQHQFGGVLNSRRVATARSLDSWTRSCTLSCTHTICWLQWDHPYRNTSGGRNIWPSCKWWVHF